MARHEPAGRQSAGEPPPLKLKVQLDPSGKWQAVEPPREMVERDPTVAPRLTQTPRGMGIPGGTESPLGARAMILAANGQDSGYRIHGTTEPETVGTNVSSGCIRMVNQDVIHLYGRTTQSNRVLVLA